MELLEKHFDIAFAAPDGIKRLRELILTLAMQGKLVPQYPNDQPASELLKEIETEKKRLVKAGKIKEPKRLPAIKDEEVPYVLPQGWEWVRLGEISNYNGRKNVAPEEIHPDTWLLDLEDIEKDTSRLIYRAKYCERQSKSTKSTFEKGDVLYGKLRPYLNKVIVADKQGVCTTEIVPIVPLGNIDSQFLKWLLKRPSFLNHVNALMYGVKMPRLGTDDAINSVHPLPPLAEQCRIVAKIDQLMVRCDELEKLRAEREQKRLNVHTAALNSLLLAEKNDSFTDAWQLITLHFGELYSVRENVAELRKAILQLAVMGRLVPQDQNDSPASELLKEIEAEKQRLVKAKKIKIPKPIPTISREGEPFQVPDNWRWVRIAEVTESIDYGTSQKTCDDASLVPVFRMGNIVNGQLIDEGFKYISPSIDELPRLYLQPNDILFNRTNSYDLVGKTACYSGPAKYATFASYLIRIRLLDALLNPIFITLAMNAPYFRKTQVEPEIVQQCGQANFNGSKLALCLIPLPPLREQQRIVARINELMAMCDELDRQITAASDKQASLLNAIIAQV
ncbi:restriction endonuclease subunit S [Geobacter argillaceus]|uniref:Type I restriction enzyme S subunit n=1 Tax=Geobacter argillaceus TaxID=345631 RepID=A0A562V5I3_9BACT|nr:restriction endonuclease subunit S [Geobacter argillaceus]TWJ13125.1 type I restriction enzyme S subunit [Geobacter argillaceus]